MPISSFYCPLFTVLSARGVFLSFLRVEWKVSLFSWESRRRRCLVLGWFMSHTLLGCYAWIIDCPSSMATVGSWWCCRNVTLLMLQWHDIKKARLKGFHPRTLLSHCVWERQRCLSGFYFRGTDLAFATLSAQDSAPTSRRALNISNHGGLSFCF